MAKYPWKLLEQHVAANGDAIKIHKNVLSGELRTKRYPQKPKVVRGFPDDAGPPEPKSPNQRWLNGEVAAVCRKV